MIEVENAIKLLTDNTKACDKFLSLHIDEVCGMVSYEDIRAPFSVPHFPKSAMDGYAVNSKDIANASADNPVRLKVINEILAGDYKECEVLPNTAVRIMTGAMVPQGYDLVVRQEDTDYGEDMVNIYKSLKPYSNYCKVGEDIKEGTILIAKDEIIRDVHIGLLASLGISYVKVKRPLLVAIIATGSELIDIDMPLTSGKIYNSTSYILKAKIKKSGQSVVGVEKCSDDEELFKALIDKYSELADLIITTGGVSVGKKDIVAKALDDMTAVNFFERLNIQPGTPTKAYLYKGKPILNLSGNPYAALANFEIFYNSYLAYFMNNKAFENDIKNAILDSEYNKQNKLRRLVRAYYKDGLVRLVDEVHASSVIANLTKCNCFIDVKENTVINKGDKVKIILFKE